MVEKSKSIIAEKMFYEVSEEVENRYAIIMDCAIVKQGLEHIAADCAKMMTDLKKIVSIPAPTFKEKKRGEYFMKRLAELGLVDVKMDRVGNVYGTRLGTGNGPTILVDAHLDTVFSAATDVMPVERDGKIFAPGISDDACGLAAILSVVRAFTTSRIKTVGDIIFCGTVGHEGTGNLLGIKTIYRDNPHINAAVHLEPENGIVYLATGSRRYEVTFKGPGGHSWNEFGLPSAIHALSRAVAEIADIKTTQDPKTTFTVGIVKGGTSVNSIAADASLQLDMRSNSEEELLKLEAGILPLFQKAADTENARWNHEMKITVDCKKIGDRPAGSQSVNAKIVQAAVMAYKALKLNPVMLGPCSTNANVSIDLGIPAVVVGAVENSGDAHALTEWIEIKNAYHGPQKLFLMILGLAGIAEMVAPLIDSAANS